MSSAGGSAGSVPGGDSSSLSYANLDSFFAKLVGAPPSAVPPHLSHPYPQAGDLPPHAPLTTSAPAAAVSGATNPARAQTSVASLPLQPALIQSSQDATHAASLPSPPIPPPQATLLPIALGSQPAASYPHLSLPSLPPAGAPAASESSPFMEFLKQQRLQLQLQQQQVCSPTTALLLAAQPPHR